MGLSALDPADWLWRDEDFAAETAERARAARRAAGRGAGRAARGRCRRGRARGHGRGTFGPAAGTRHARRPGRAGAGGFLRPAAKRRRPVRADRRALVLSRALAAGREAGPAAARDPRAGAGLRRPAGRPGRPVLRQSHRRAAGLAGELVGGRERRRYSTRSRAMPCPTSRPRTPGRSCGCGSSARPCAACRRAGRSCSPSAPWSAPWPRSPPTRPWPAPWPRDLREMEPGMAGYKGLAGLRGPLLGLARRPRVTGSPPAAGRAAPAACGTAAGPGSRRA